MTTKFDDKGLLYAETARCGCGLAYPLSEPYDPSALRRHWFSGPCPECAYAVGGNGSYSSNDGKPINTRYKHTVVDEPKDGA